MTVAKAVTAFVVTLASLVGATLADNQVDAGELSQGAAVTVDAVLVLLSALGVWAVPNKTKTPPVVVNPSEQSKTL